MGLRFFNFGLFGKSEGVLGINGNGVERRFGA